MKKILMTLGSSTLLCIGLTACGGGGSSNSSSGGGSGPSGSNNYIVVNMTPSNALSTHVNMDTTVTLKIATTDSNPASSLNIQSSSLPAGWSAVSGLTCTTVPSQTSGNTCDISLKYSPTVPANQIENFDVPITYINNAGIRQTASQNISYNSLPPVFAYAVDYQSNTVKQCMINADGTLASSCQSIVSGLFYPRKIVFQRLGNVDYAYIANSGTNGTNSVMKCPVNSDGTFGPCVDSGFNFDKPIDITFNTMDGVTSAYVQNEDINTNNFNLYQCTINQVNGGFPSCTPIETNPDFNALTFQTVNGQLFAYRVGQEEAHCPVNSDGTFGACTTDAYTSLGGLRIAFQNLNSNLYAYIISGRTGGSISQCKVNSDASISPANCTSLTLNNISIPSDISFQNFSSDNTPANAYAYVSGVVNSGSTPGSVSRCLVDPSSGALSSCINTADNNGLTGTFWSTALHYYGGS